MKRLICGWVAMVMAGIAGTAWAVEEPPHEVVEKEGSFEVRRYAPMILAETEVAGTVETAGNRAFRRLFGYISGENGGSEKIPMTAPVTQMPAETGAVWRVGFVMPARATRATLPEPDRGDVRLVEMPGQRMAAVRYSGRWTETGYYRQVARLQDWMAERGLEAAGPPIWARYNAPFSLWFLRRNEVLIPLAAADGP